MGRDDPIGMAHNFSKAPSGFRSPRFAPSGCGLGMETSHGSLRPERRRLDPTAC